MLIYMTGTAFKFSHFESLLAPSKGFSSGIADLFLQVHSCLHVFFALMTLPLRRVG